ncbi:MAG: ubiquinone/menaquinone biosynthesis methyltransferase [Gemmatimonadetes bacterium]|nr:ubiquinone/menaquinone biosynthesis methyltransferase [Gemmatimonadota bacterium]MCB9518369.1 ubiquinone/menaquinone biosynthesis methyltransferase [Gemmatimonadales bacterium]MCA9762593.1 ubiquinone/menaquinone biosynthesis methyltransferase [Gemmatimonadota bacterium]MCA9768232.1 ubiquinone/menaquinone biosynthesis methyltransferase [Gemmatimonadota bacterium]HPF62818.1 ubiquinone/menaquinone biosynthesis methyltransferase [Gemmatimonadales bacterium]
MPEIEIETEPSLPLAGGDAKQAYVREMFRSIAPRYDLLNHVLSLNADRRWRRTAVDRLGWTDRPDGTYLDACAGTRDLSAELGNRPGFTGRVVASDFVPAMLAAGRDKSARVRAAAADTLRLPFGDDSFDGAMVGFGVRNLMDLDAGLREMARVLRPGRRLVILEFTTPTWQPLRAMYLGYFRQILPRIGRLVSKHRSAYDWLPASVLAFPDPPTLAARLEAAGFRDVRWATHWGGIVAIHTGELTAA